ncbi:hypothetical protein F511_05150 [Dorcoceras hygrometricum]|uniref:protein-tyrosine-phosphatase n=1 Tax=Dorcoceras hygrometricum TaxID=472368 RepID=A0A2Z7C1W5_9LAMI|nr:hypothetical protein F511_05150 [Dorcoceras hygrometricum]
MSPTRKALAVEATILAAPPSPSQLDNSFQITADPTIRKLKLSPDQLRNCHEALKFLRSKKLSYPHVISQEFQTLQANRMNDLDLKNRCSVALDRTNLSKNRYINVLPFDNNRVILKHLIDNRGSHGKYINASFIMTSESVSRFIATQGPLPLTSEDFWEMILQYRCPAIVMLTRLVENQHTVKCGDYFQADNGPREFGNICISTKWVQTTDTQLILRCLEVKRKESVEPSFCVLHIQYPEWPDLGVPNATIALREIFRKLSVVPLVLGPIVVHCSAGIGRTGTYCLIHNTIQRLLLGDMSALDLATTLSTFRSQRSGIVQTQVCLPDSPSSHHQVHTGKRREIGSYMEADAEVNNSQVHSLEVQPPLTAEPPEKIILVAAIADIFTGFRGGPVSLTFNPSSEIYHAVVSKCKTLHGRYLATPWLSNPHFQTSFINFFGKPPVFSYRRQMFHASDGGSFALDWLMHFDVSGLDSRNNHDMAEDDATPIIVMIPGLTSDSASPYMKHLVFNTAKHGWNVVVSNHRGLGGVSVTSDCFYNAGWTEDVREVINYLHEKYYAAPLFVVGTSIGANILVKYLGEDGKNVPVAGAAAVCSPWDLLIGSRFISRRLIQKLYDRALTIGLQGYAQLHETRYSRLANWEGIKKSRSIRDFDTHATCLVGNYETVDTYYRRCSSAAFIGQVSVPLLCISALDDPVCTKEAIPWDECRANKNVVLATTQHGGHLAFFEGFTGSGLWWVRAVIEFLEVLHSSSYMHIQKKESSGAHSAVLQSSIDQGPYLNVADGMVAAMGNDPTDGGINATSDVDTGNHVVTDSRKPDFASFVVQNSEDGADSKGSTIIERCLYQISRQNKTSIWLLAYVALLSSWPIVGAALGFFFKKKIKKTLLGKTT